MFVWSRVHNLIGVALAMEIYLPRYLAWKLLLHMTRMFQYFVRTVFSMHSWTLLMSGAQWADQRESTESCTDRVWFICIWTVPHAQFLRFRGQLHETPAANEWEAWMNESALRSEVNGYWPHTGTNSPKDSAIHTRSANNTRWNICFTSFCCDQNSCFPPAHASHDNIITSWETGADYNNKIQGN